MSLICAGVSGGCPRSQRGLSDTSASLNAGVRGAFSPGKSSASRGAGV